MISRVVIPGYNPTKNGRGFLFFHILASICCHLRFYRCHFNCLRCNLSVILICTSPMTKKVEHFLRYFLSTWYSSSGNSLFNSVPHFNRIFFTSFTCPYISHIAESPVSASLYLPGHVIWYSQWEAKSLVNFLYIQPIF